MAENEDKPRLIEKRFPLQQTSIESVHEKMCHSGHIKAIHIWPARRPLAACRAAIVTSLLSNPQDSEERNRILELLAGKIIETKEKTGKNKKITVGGVLRWKSENAEAMDILREMIKKNYPDRPPRLLDPFAGGGAIPFEGMRAGCEVTAMDINPVAWFILKCTLEYPQRFSGKTFPIPEVVLQYCEPVNELKSNIRVKKERRHISISTQSRIDGSPEYPLASHVRAWSLYVLQRVQERHLNYYPSLADEKILGYLWARTVKCKNCRAEIPLLKSLWLGHNSNNRTLVKLKTNSNRSGVDFEIVEKVPVLGTTKNEKIDNDKKIGKGTMSRSGTWCPCCGRQGTVAMTTDDIRQEARLGKLGQRMYAVILVDDDKEVGKKFRLPTALDVNASKEAEEEVAKTFKNIPFGMPDDPLPSKEALGFRIPLYGFDRWYKLFTPRQLICLGTFIQEIRDLKETLKEYGYSEEWIEAITCYLACIIDKLADYNSGFVHWQPAGPKGGNTFMRWAFPMKTDFVENALLTSKSGGWMDITEWVIKPLSEILTETTKHAPTPHIMLESAMNIKGNYDIIITDPPYYDAIPYSDLMDFFYVWLRRTLFGLNPDFNKAFNCALSPKWDIEGNDGELIDDRSRFGGDEQQSKKVYEEGMAKTFRSMHNALNTDGRLVLVFAHKDPNAWETLVSALIKSGFVVNGSWPIQTEMSNRTRSQSSAALSSSVWMVCRKRPESATIGWDNRVLEEMRTNIFTQLRDYWDAGIRGPDFVWAATGPALEAYSKHPIVKKADNPGEIMTVSEFLKEVRRIVMDFVVGRVLGNENEKDHDLDNTTTYYLLHRHDFGFENAPAGSCILYAVSCDLSDNALVGEYDILLKSGGMEEPAEDEGEETEEDFLGEGTSSTFRLKAWNKRKSKNLGMDSNGRPAPMIDRVQKLMHLWKDGDIVKVDDYLESNGLLKNKTFHHILQAIIELSKEGDEERSLLESISNHIISRGGAVSAPRDLSNFGG